ncbi:hypothetical protein M0R45_005034 [Rubus argutus]|uniref:Uncharacterized protein n=1 Tax=Rubus argutus TaxID=59490 RepID=A0AAW1YLN6_RUBAR
MHSRRHSLKRLDAIALSTAAPPVPSRTIAPTHRAQPAHQTAPSQHLLPCFPPVNPNSQEHRAMISLHCRSSIRREPERHTPHGSPTYAVDAAVRGGAPLPPTNLINPASPIA